MTRETKAAYGDKRWFEQKFSESGYQDAHGYYSHSVNGYQRFRHRFLVAILREQIPADKPLRVLDVGCGVGDFLHLIAENWQIREGIGVDFVEPVIQMAQLRFPEITFLHDSLPALERLSGDKFDLIIANEVLYYLREGERSRCMARLEGLLDPAGHLLISSTIAPHTFTRESLSKLVAPYFTIQGVWIQTSKLYLLLHRVCQLPFILDVEKESEQWRIHYRLIYGVYRLPVISRLLRSVNRQIMRLAAVFLQSELSPRYLTVIGSLIGERWTKSNLIFVLKSNDQ